MSKVFKEIVFNFDESKQEEIDDLLYGEYDYYTIDSSEGKFLAVVSFYPEQLDEVKEKLTEIGLKYIGMRETRPEDWVKNIITEPFEMIEGVVIDPMDHNLEEQGNIILKIPQGLAFGTGLHQTTKMSAMYLKKYLKPGMDVLDLGCGSGILGILAKKLGANRVVAVDNDPLAVEVAQENAVRNRVDIDVKWSDLFSNVEGKFDIIVSNIIAEILVEMLKQAKNHLKDDGILILSGIITQKSNLFDQYNVIEKMVMDEWNALVIKI
ncbi:MAG: 50S ribosomal protein L11 methyltransferase [Fervidobacterium sp.]|uniref:Ribosomal protein L11 methyltransferase n=1 Tax=Fervidobacterium gondwanense DSM 13020 TaxID=1121883 RepID=A0A1M7RY76_FERGO|nr:50S ribosomal protein L11 methyltransferase [Fervidobacterium gondwanense]UXF00110.1 ribosomal protein L11 methyltransferase [Fervidobacterium riparium]SHN51175.1 [LSU ribosomal protein L11P]-lysine N-methyltransferase [Fervidobacterium gondwanense DSM 13020]